MAVGALATATVGALETEASNRGREAAADATSAALTATRVSAHGQERALSTLIDAALLAEQQVRRANALRLAAHADASAAERAAAAREARSWGAIAEVTASRVNSLLAADPDGDASRLLAETGLEADERWGHEFAARREAREWGSTIANYGFILTIVAIAVALLGLSLTFPDWSRLLLAGVAISLLAGGVGWAAYEAPRSPERLRETASQSYAHARRLLALGNYRGARRRFEETGEMRTDFAPAAHGYANAIFLDETSQAGAQYPSLVPAKALAAASRTLTKAYERKVRTYGVIATLGFYSFLRALEEDDRELHRQSVDLTSDATEILKDDPAAYYNLGLAHLASGDVEKAHTAYTDALVRTLALKDVAPPHEWVAGALTDLTLLEAQLEDGAGRAEAQRIKGTIVGAVAAGQLRPRRPAVQIADAQLAVTPAAVHWRARFIPEPRDDATLWVQWYRYDEEADGWGGIATLSGQTAPQAAPDGSYADEVGLAAVPDGRCLEPGRYRAEFYVDGTLAGSAKTVASSKDVGADDKRPLTATVDRLLSVSLCRPPAWKRSAGLVPGLAAGYVDKRRDRGIYVERSSGPTAAAVDRLVARLPAPAKAPGYIRLTRAIPTSGGTRIVVVAFGPRRATPLLEKLVDAVADYDPVRA
jgi:tetratricopeptide (TPR) repeat protein